MTVRILLDGPKRSVSRRVTRIVAVLVGLPMLIVGIAALVLTALVALYFGWFVTTTPDSVSAKDQRETAIVGACALGGALIFIPLGVRLIRGRRHLVLFLRRFGFADATRALSYAAMNAMGATWRLVTLDDARVEAVGGPAVRRRLIGLLSFLFVVGTGYLTWWLATHSAEDLAKGSNTTG